jgi:hypothetical protein
MTVLARDFARLVVVAIGCLTGAFHAFAGLEALFVSQGTFSDWALISGIFFTTLPVSLLGLVAPRPAGVALATVALLSAAALSIQEGALPWRLWVMYTAPAVLVGVALIWTARERNQPPLPESGDVVI